MTKKDLYGLTVKVNTLLTHVDLLSVERSEAAVKEHSDSIDNFRSQIGEMLSYIENDFDQLHRRIQVVETKFRNW